VFIFLVRKFSGTNENRQLFRGYISLFATKVVPGPDCGTEVAQGGTKGVDCILVTAFAWLVTHFCDRAEKKPVTSDSVTSSEWSIILKMQLP
jgi:hypothetical protein